MGTTSALSKLATLADAALLHGDSELQDSGAAPAGGELGTATAAHSGGTGTAAAAPGPRDQPPPASAEWYAGEVGDRLHIPVKSSRGLMPQRWALGQKPPEFLTVTAIDLQGADRRHTLQFDKRTDTNWTMRATLGSWTPLSRALAALLPDKPERLPRGTKLALCAPLEGEVHLRLLRPSVAKIAASGQGPPEPRLTPMPVAVASAPATMASAAPAAAAAPVPASASDGAPQAEGQPQKRPKVYLASQKSNATYIHLDSAQAREMLAGFPWPERLLLRAPDGCTFEAGISKVCFQTLGGWHHIRNHMKLQSHTGPIGISTTDGKVFDVTVDLASSPAAPKSQPQRSPPQQRPPSQRCTPLGKPSTQALPPLPLPGAPASGKAASGPARQQQASQRQQQQQQLQQRHPPQQQQAIGSSPGNSVPAGSPQTGQQHGSHQHAAGNLAAVGAIAGGANAAATGQQDGFYLQVYNPGALMLSKRLLRTLFRSPIWPRQLQLTVPGAPVPLPVKTESDTSGRLLPKNGWAAAAAALAAAAGAPLQQGSVLHISRPPAGGGGNELRLRMVTGPELTPSVQAVAALTAGPQWTSSTKYEFFVGAQAGGSRKRQRSDGASGTSCGAAPAKRPVTFKTQHLTDSVTPAVASRQQPQQPQQPQQQHQLQPTANKVATEREAGNGKQRHGIDAAGIDLHVPLAKRQAGPTQQARVAAAPCVCTLCDGAAAEVAPAVVGSLPQPADSGLSAEAPREAAVVEVHSSLQPAQPGRAAPASAQAAAAASAPKEAVQKSTAPRQGPLPHQSRPAAAPPHLQPPQAQPVAAACQATAARDAPWPLPDAISQQPAGQQARIAAAPPSQGHQLSARPAATAGPAAAQAPPAAADPSSPDKQAAAAAGPAAAAAPAQQPQPVALPHGGAQPADPHEPQQQSVPAGGSAAASDVKREPQEQRWALALAPQEQWRLYFLAAAPQDPQTLASSSQTAHLQLQQADVAHSILGRSAHVCSLREADAIASATASTVDVYLEALEDAHNAEARVLIEEGRLDWKYKVLMRDDAWGPADPLQPPVHGSARAVLEQGCQFRVWGGSLRRSPVAAPHTGVYAREAIPAGSFVIEVVGELVSQAEEPASTAAQRTFLHPLLPPGPVPAAAQAPQPVAWLDLRRKANIARLLNMAGDHANLRRVYLHDAQRPQAPPHLLLMAARTIAKGNELLL